MSGETQITIVGNTTSDAELRYTSGGVAVANLTIASTPKTFDRQKNEWTDGTTLFLRSTCWRDLAEHVAASIPKGTRVVAQGRLTQREFNDRDGNKRTAIELEVDEIGPSLRYATAQVTRSHGGTGTRPQSSGDVWNTDAQGVADADAPF